MNHPILSILQMGKRFFAPTILVILTMLFVSCEKVVNIDLNETDPMYVIEGEVFEGTNPLRVKIAKTTDYYGKAPQTLIDDATVVIGLPDGTTTTVPSTGNGIYILPDFNAIGGSTYTLKVQVEGQEFTASTVVPAAVPFDSINYEYDDAAADFIDPGYEVTAFITDPLEANNFRAIVTVNDTAQDGLALFDDKFNNGQTIELDPFDRFRLGDTITIELRTMDRPVYDFFTTLSEALSNGQGGPAPANPLTNIKGGALGYFGGFGVSKIGVRIRE